MTDFIDVSALTRHGDTFNCHRLHAPRQTVRTCLARQSARTESRVGRGRPVHPGCVSCPDGQRIAEKMAGVRDERTGQAVVVPEYIKPAPPAEPAPRTYKPRIPPIKPVCAPRPAPPEHPCAVADCKELAAPYTAGLAEPLRVLCRRHRNAATNARGFQGRSNEQAVEKVGGVVPAVPVPSVAVVTPPSVLPIVTNASGGTRPSIPRQPVAPMVSARTILDTELARNVARLTDPQHASLCAFVRTMVAR